MLSPVQPHGLYCSLPGSSVHAILFFFFCPCNSSGKNMEWVAISSLQGIFPTQGLNPCLSGLMGFLYQLRSPWDPLAGKTNLKTPPLSAEFISEIHPVPISRILSYCLKHKLFILFHPSIILIHSCSFAVGFFSLDPTPAVVPLRLEPCSLDHLCWFMFLFAQHPSSTPSNNRHTLPMGKAHVLEMTIQPSHPSLDLFLGLLW